MRPSWDEYFMRIAGEVAAQGDFGIRSSNSYEGLHLRKGE